MKKQYQLHLGDCLEIMRTLPDNSVDSIVTDPPYELGFMGKKWDSTGIANSVEMWSECFRVLKHGGHLLSFSGSRTYHRMTCAIEDAGFEIHDQIMWVYGSGFPKSMNISKAIDKAAGAEREVGKLKYIVGDHTKAIETYGFKESGGNSSAMNTPTKAIYASIPSTDAAKQWDGWGTALKPAHEPICVARKPLSEKTIAENVLKHGTGGLNIDGCRVGDGAKKWATPRCGIWATNSGSTAELIDNPLGRFPANLIHDGSDDVLKAFPDAKGQQGDLAPTGKDRLSKGIYSDMPPPVSHIARIESDKPSARFFYCAKASNTDRDEGLAAFDKLRTGCMSATQDGSMLTGSGNERTTTRSNIHPTVKPTNLMAYLCRLVTPPNGTVLDPFMGSGSTGKAAMREGFKFIGIDMTPEYLPIADARICHELFSDLI